MDKTNGKTTIVCGNGQLRLAVLVQAESGSSFWYAGDFDPEGLSIAQKLKKRYGVQLHLWRYEKEDYEMAKSEKTVSSTSLKQLESLEEPALKQMGEWIRTSGFAGYQENMEWEVP